MQLTEDKTNSNGWETMKSSNQLLRICGFVIALYLLLYCVLLDPGTPSRDDSGTIVYRSAFRWGRVHVTRVDERRVWFIGPSVFNYVFYPIDALLDAFWPIESDRSMPH